MSLKKNVKKALKCLHFDIFQSLCDWTDQNNWIKQFNLET